jgi:hypothetical protein
MGILMKFKRFCTAKEIVSKLKKPPIALEISFVTYIYQTKD